MRLKVGGEFVEPRLVVLEPSIKVLQGREGKRKGQSGMWGSRAEQLELERVEEAGKELQQTRFSTEHSWWMRKDSKSCSLGRERIRGRGKRAKYQLEESGTSLGSTKVSSAHEMGEQLEERRSSKESESSLQACDQIRRSEAEKEGGEELAHVVPLRTSSKLTTSLSPFRTLPTFPSQPTTAEWERGILFEDRRERGWWEGVGGEKVGDPTGDDRGTSRVAAQRNANLTRGPG